MQKHKNFKFKGFLNFSYEAEIHEVPKTQEKWISIVREKYGKRETFQIYGFLKYLGEAEIHQFQNMGKVNPHNTGKVWEKTNI